jgi:hypothetical protein
MGSVEERLSVKVVRRQGLRLGAAKYDIDAVGQTVK